MNFSDVSIQDLQLAHSVEVNPSSGSTSASINIPLPDARAGFNPGLSLHYSSSSRNSIFGMGWSLGGLPFIGLDTKKELPKYDGSDKFAFNGSNSLVPYLIRNGIAWQQRVHENADYWIYYYRSKYETSFTRFEKWVSKTSRDIHWRTRSKDNVISIYGLDERGITKIFDPENSNKVFIWLLESQYDDSGNAIQYKYKAENADNINPIDSYETGRIKNFKTKGFAQRYLERIVYGNTKPITPDTSIPANNKWLFEAVFDYGQFSNRPYTDSIPVAGSMWAKRADPFSVYNPGFEIRTYRLCKRILVYHHFDELSTPTSLTGIFECTFNESESGTTLQSVAYTGVRRELISGNYSEKTLPKLIFNYAQPEIGRTFQGIVQETNENLPQGFNHIKTRIIDLFGEGVPGILTETANTWYYKPNLGNGNFGKQEIIINKPSQQQGIFALGDFDNDGNINLFSLQGRTAGYYEYDRDSEKWSGFTAFPNIPQVGNSKFIDVNADGLPDLVVESDDKIICYPFKGKEGFGAPYEFSKPLSNGVAHAPMIGDNLSLDYFLADMTGDGLPDQVRIKNGRVEYFPNLGNGHFGEGVIMENAPVIDFDTSFDASRIRLFDLDGSGTTDIIYLGNGEIRYWYNASGNKFTAGGKITNLPYIDNISSAIILDFLGNGTPCLAWSNSLNYLQYSTIQYLELTNGIKPRLLTSLENSMGKEIQIQYGYSGNHYLLAKKSSNPWISKMPTHFTVVDKKTIIDHITNARFTTQFTYKDGHYDGNERTFVTFGLTEQFDTELFENASLTHEKDYAQPSCQKTWFHNGIFRWDAKRAKQFYNKDPKQQFLTPQRFEQSEAFESDDFDMGYRSLAGSVIRQEIFAASQDGVAEDHPYQITQNAYCIRKIQPKTAKQDSCFFAFQTEVVSYDYEKQATDPKIAHHLSIAINEYGDIEKELSIAYARRSSASNIHPAQSRDYITASIHRYVHADVLSKYQPGILFEGKDFEVNHINHPPDELLQLQGVQLLFDELIPNAINFDEQLPALGDSKAKLISWERTYFWNDAFDDVLSLGQTGTLLFSHHEESACFNDNTIVQAFSAKVTPAMLSAGNEGNYTQRDGYWWQRTPTNYFKDANSFFSLDRIEREPGNITRYNYDPYYLNIIEIIDPVGNVNTGAIDYNVVEPFRLIDQNGTVAEVLYDPLGVSIATFRQGTLLDETDKTRLYGSGLIADYTRSNEESFDNILAKPQNFLQKADTFLFYDLDCWKDEKKPLRSISITRENLVHDGKGIIDKTCKCQLGIEYEDGFGRVIQSKQKVEPGPAVKRRADGSVELDAGGDPVMVLTPERWLVSGHVVNNNKQQPVRQFEAFFSALVEFEQDDVLESYGVSAQNYYDAVGRVYRTELPNSTFTEVRFSAWEIQSFDQNDTVDRSVYKALREFLPNDSPEKMALTRSLAHKETPTIVMLDPLGREIVSIQTNNDGTERKVENKYDINGNIAEIIDARNLNAFEYKRDMLGRLLYEKSRDAGEKWSFHNNLDQTIHLWDSRNIHQRTHYDALDRALTVRVNGALGLNHITERFIYGEDPTLNQTKGRNFRGQLVKHYDQAGTQEIKVFTPEGLPVLAERKLLDQFTAEPNWNYPATIGFDADTFISKYAYDALGRPVQQELPDQTTRRFIFNQGGGVQKVLVSTADGLMSDVEILKNVSYDAKGLRQQAILGNDVALNYTYDKETFRMTRLYAKKTGPPRRTYQDVAYTYDPVGNLIYCLDRAQQPDAANPHVIEGLNVSAHSEFEYDALYQLKSAKGRVHQALLQHDYTDRSREAGVPANWAKGTRHITLNNGAAIERYTREYEYDPAGNIKSIKHAGASQNWTKQIWTSATSNRSLPLNDLNGNAITDPESRFDANGNCKYMPHLRNINWNYRNNIAKAVVIDRSAQGKINDEEYYVYGGDGMRVRKITLRLVNVANNTIERIEKIYLDSCEIKRITRGGTEVLRRFTSHITDGTNNIARIHAWDSDISARETINIAQKKIHYQLSNHLGSASLELDENGDVITYEEYFPYGGTSFIAGRNKRDINLKDFRYSGKEQDDFSGLYYFGYRYYAHWIGGWMSPDPLGPEDSENLYLYVQNNPVNLVDANGLQSSDSNFKITVSHVQSLPSDFKSAINSLAPDQRARFDSREIGAYRHPETSKIIFLTNSEAENLAKQYNLPINIQIENSLRQDPDWQKWRDTGMSEKKSDSMVELFNSIDELLSSLNGELPNKNGIGNGATTGAGGEPADSKGTGKSDDTASSGTKGTGDKDPGAGRQGTGLGTTTGSGKGAESRPGNSQGPGTGTTRGHGGVTGNGQQGGQVGGTGDKIGGKIGGTPNASEHGSVNGSLDGYEDGIEGGNGVNGAPDGVNPGTIEGSGTGGNGKDRNGTGYGNSGSGNGVKGGGGLNQKIFNEETWYERAIMAMGGAIFSIANIFIEAGKQIYDFQGLEIQFFGNLTGLYDYEHKAVSGIGMAAQQGQGTLDIFKSMGKGIIETPKRWLDAIDRGDYFAFGAESMNFYSLGRGGVSFLKGVPSFVFNRSVGALGRFGARGIKIRDFIRNKQVQRIGANVSRRLGLSNQGLNWKYGGSGPRAYGSYSPGTRTVSINEGSFTPSLLHRLPGPLRSFSQMVRNPLSLFRGAGSIFQGPYSIFTRLGISRMLRGRSTMTTPIHEGWHAAQHSQQPAWYTSIPRTQGNYNIRPHEFTQIGSQPMMGAHNYAFRFAMPSDFSIFFGLYGTTNNNTNRH